jgi:hypothetical protein
VVEQSAVNRLVAGSSPAWGVFVIKKLFTLNIFKILLIIKSLYLDYLIAFYKKNKMII